MEHMNNEEVLTKTGTKRALVFRVSKRQLKFLRYLMRKKDLANLTLIRYIGYIWDREKQGVTFLTGLCKWTAQHGPGKLVRRQILFGTRKERTF